MRYTLLLFLLVLQFDISGQDIQLREKGFIDISYRSNRGDQTKFSDVKLAPGTIIDVKSIDYNMPHFVFILKAWNLIGDLVLNPILYWELNKEMLFFKSGTAAGASISFEKIKKYPDLATRYLAIQPLSVRIGTQLELYDKEGKSQSVLVELNNNEIQYGSSGLTRFPTSPFSPFKWTDNIVLGSNSDLLLNGTFDILKGSEKEVRDVISNALQLRGSDLAFKMKITWPDEAIEEIAKLYDEYEKRKKSPSPLEQVETETKKKLPKYIANDEWASPFEDVLKDVKLEFDNNKKEYALKSGNRLIKVFDGRDYSLTADNVPKGYFIVRKQGEYIKGSVVDKTGTIISVDGITEFDAINYKNGNLELLKRTGSKSLLMTACAGYSPGGFYETSSEAQSKVDESKASMKREMKGTQITACWDFYGGSALKILTSDKLVVLNKKTGYLVATN